IERLDDAHLPAVHEARLTFARQRKALPRLGVYADYRAVMHVHAEDADHTKGTRPEVLRAAKSAGVSVVMFTDHRGPKTTICCAFPDRAATCAFSPTWKKRRKPRLTAFREWKSTTGTPTRRTRRL